MKTTPQSSAPLVFSTETHAYRRAAFRAFVCCCILGAGCSIVLQCILPAASHDWNSVILIASVEGTFLFMGLFCVFEPFRGTWRVDDAGFHYEPYDGKPRSLAWHEVERVLWTHERHVVLKGAGKRLGLVAGDRAFRDGARARIEKHLARDFDLTLKPPRPRPVDHRPPKERALGFLLALEAGFNLTMLAIGLPLALVLYDPLMKAGWFGLAWFWLWFAIPAAVGLRYVVREERRRPPAWRRRRLE